MYNVAKTMIKKAKFLLIFALMLSIFGCATLAQQRGGLRYNESRDYTIISTHSQARVYDYSALPISYLGDTPLQIQLFRSEFELLPPQAPVTRKVLKKELMCVYGNRVIFREINQFTKENVLELDFADEAKSRELTPIQESILKHELALGMTRPEAEKSIGKLDRFNAKVSPAGIVIIYVGKIKDEQGNLKTLDKVLRFKDDKLISMENY